LEKENKMAHPMNDKRDHKVQHARVKDITAACGGGMSTGGSATGVIAKQQRMLGKVPQRADGGAVKARADRPARARGGRLGKKKSGGKHTVNVIVAPHAPAPAGGAPPMPHPMVPGVAAGPPPGGPPPAGGPPPMPPRPMGAPPMGGAPGPGGPGIPGAGMLPPGVPPPGIRYTGGRTYKKGGAVFSGTAGKAAFTTKGKPKASSNDADSQTAGAGKGRTPISRSFPSNKQDTPNIGRGSVVTKATGGPISSQHAKMGPKFMGGGMGGIAKLQKEKRAIKSGYGAATRTAMNPTANPKG
jgi:hypothetical protein